MGVVNLGEQRASRQVLGNVRMGITPDLSKQWKGLQSIGEGISDLAFAIPRAINTLDAAFERDAENEANKLYSAYLTHMEESLNSPGDPNNPDGAKGLFVRAEEDDDAAKSLNENIKTAREQILETIGYNDASKRTQEKFKLRAQNYDFSTDRKANSIMTARFHFSEKANASLALETATRVAMNDPTDANLDACRMAFLSVAKANGYTDAQTETGMGALNRNLAVGLLVEKAAGTQNPEEVQQIIESVKKGDVRFMGGEDKERGEWIQETFDQLQPTEKKALLGKLATRESMAKDNQAKLYNDAITEVNMKVRNGEITATQIKEKLDEWKKGGVPIQFVDKMDIAYHAQQSAETGQTISKLAAGVKTKEDGEKTLEALDAMTPEQKEHPDWIRLRTFIEKGMAETFMAEQQDESEVRYNMAKYNNGKYIRTMEERIRIIDNPDPDPRNQGLLQRGLITQEKAEEAIKYIKASEDARIQPILQECFRDLPLFAQRMGQAGEGMVPEVVNVRWKLNGLNVDLSGAISGYSAYNTGKLSEEQLQNITILSSYLQKCADKLVARAQAHPEETAKELRNFWGDITYPILPNLTAYKIMTMAPGTRDFADTKFLALDTVRFADAPGAAIDERARYNPTPGTEMVFLTRGSGRAAFENPNYDRTPTQQRVEHRSQMALQKQREAEAQAKAKAEAEAKAKEKAEKKAKEEEEPKTSEQQPPDKQ